MNVELGNKYEDAVTGFRGTATAVCKHLDGTTQVKLTPQVSKEGNANEALWVDVRRARPYVDGSKVGYQPTASGG